MDYVIPSEVVAEAAQLARKKGELSISSMMVRGMLAGAFLGFATSLSIAVEAQGVAPIVGAILFPIGFVMLVLLGLELATGNFALFPIGILSETVRWRSLLKNWTFVYLGNLLGSVLYAALFYLAITNCGTNDGAAMGALVKQIAQKKTLAYATLGGSGWATAVIKAVLCNWMVTVGAVLALTSRSTIGKITAMWLPILLFFALRYEHSIVNMYVIPSAMMLGAKISFRDWWIWNQIPVTLGNIFGGAVLTGGALYAAHGTQATPAPTLMPKLEPALAQESEATV